MLDSEENKNEKIEKFYLKKNSLNKDQILKEKLFGTYDITEILDIIERNLILKDFFLLI